MKASILIIGDEILNGTTTDTNSAFIARKSAEYGIDIQTITTISDKYDAILYGLKNIPENCKIVFITGGLGPTKDDITLKTLADFFNQKLVFNEQVYEKIKAYFEKRGKAQVALNKKLAMLPEKCTLVQNDNGTAQGMWFEANDKVYISMPGVPYEMENMLTKHVLLKIKSTFELAPILNKYIMTAGIGESAIAEKIKDIENDLPNYLSLAYLPSLKRVKLRLTASRFSKEIEAEMLAFQNQIAEKLKKYVFSFNENDSLEKVIGEILKERKETLSTAESCTGGLIAHKITSIAGSSEYYEGSFITYSNEMKMQALGVKKTTLEKYGAVSEAIVIEMTKGLIEKTNTTYGIAVSGVAGPGGGTPEKPVGTVWIAISDKERCVTRKYHLTPYRGINIQLSAVLALNLLRRFIKNDIQKRGSSNEVVN